MENPMYGLQQSTPLTLIVAHRDAALKTMDRALVALAEGHALAQQAQTEARGAHKGTSFSLSDRAGSSSAYQCIFHSFDVEESRTMYRRHLDAAVWTHLMTITGMVHLMDRTAKDKFYEELCGEVPEVSEEAVRERFMDLAGDANLIFQRGLACAFSDLDRRFKSHDGFKIGSRIILTNVFDKWGSWNYHARMEDTMADIQRVFAVLDQKAPEPFALRDALQETRRGMHSAHQSETITPYFKVRCFQNGNVHLWFTRDDLVEKANLMLADYYGAVLADAVPDDVPADLHSKSGLPARNLSFYATPDKVVRLVLRDFGVREGDRVLEPSAGEGNMARALLAKGAKVDAIEIDEGRCVRLRAIDGLNVTQANFLRQQAMPVYDKVVMNPPFYGTHWMEHVVHAFDFLAPGGSLIAVLPVTAELGQTTKHKAFRKWAKAHGRGYGHQFQDLPAESFMESGTRVNTVTITLYAAR